MSENIKVVKFGGSSLAGPEHFLQVKAIIEADPSRRYVVPSAPGKRTSDDIKITDMLYECYSIAQEGESIDGIFSKITDRYEQIIAGLKLDLDLSAEYLIIKNAIQHHGGRDYAASRGEYLNGKIVAKLLGYKFIDAASVVLFKEDGSFDAELTNAVMSKKLAQYERAVIPGFYGSMPNGTIKTFTRDGSDVSGAVVARAVNATLYENWKDVSGFCMADPRIVKDPRYIDVITYRELRELSYMGASVLHSDAIFPVRSAGIPINIKNTYEPEAVGTMIVESAEHTDSDSLITGIAGKKGFSVLSIEKDSMNSELGFGRRVLEEIEQEKISFEHLPSGIDTMSVVISTAALEGRRERLLDRIKASVAPDSISLEDGLALIAVVGRGMVKATGTAARVFKACADEGVNIHMIDQGSSELDIIIGVDESDYERTVRAIYNEFN